MVIMVLKRTGGRYLLDPCDFFIAKQTLDVILSFRYNLRYYCAVFIPQIGLNHILS